MRSAALRVGGLLLACWATALPARVAADEPLLEYQVKAAFLLNFTRFVEWPPEVAAGQGPFTICLYGRDPFQGALDMTLVGESWHGHAIVLRRVGVQDPVHACQLLFVPRQETDRFREMAARGTPRGVLTVGEATDFLDAGGAINLLVEDNRVRFDIDLASTERADLRVSSRLLRLARQLHNAPAPL